MKSFEQVRLAYVKFLCVFILAKYFIRDTCVSVQFTLLPSYLSRMAEDIEASLDEILTSKRFFLDTRDVSEDGLVQEWPSFKEDLDKKLEMVLGIFGIAVTEMIINQSALPAISNIKAQQTTIR